MVKFYLRQQKCASQRNKNSFLLYWVDKTITQLYYCFFIKTSSKCVLTKNNQSIRRHIFSEEQPKFCPSRRNKNSDSYYHWLQQLSSRKEATNQHVKIKSVIWIKSRRKCTPRTSLWTVTSQTIQFTGLYSKFFFATHFFEVNNVFE